MSTFKKIIVFILLILVGEVGVGKDVILTLRAQFGNQFVPLDSIFVENITTATQLSFSNLPERNSYQINLTKKTFGGTTGVHLQNFSKNPELIGNQPGSLVFKMNNQNTSTINIVVFNVAGYLEFESGELVVTGHNSVELKIGKPGIHLVTIVTDFGKETFRAVGDLSGKNIQLKINDTLFSGTTMKSAIAVATTSSGFIFNPGDSLQITVFRRQYLATSKRIVVDETNKNILFDLTETPRIVVKFNSQPQQLAVTSTPFRFNKKLAVTYEQDDNLSGTVNSMLPLFSGGTPEFDNQKSDGLYFTDGFGTSIPFKTNSVSWVYDHTDRQYWDWASEGEETWAAHLMTYNRLDTLLQHGGSLNSHGFRYLHLMNNDVVEQAPEEYVSWLEQLHNVRPFSFIKPGEQTFNDTLWADSWFEQGALVGVLGSKAKPPCLRVDTIDFNALNKPVIMGRYILEELTADSMITYFNRVAEYPGNSWLRTFSHNITDGENFADYWQLKSFFKHLEVHWGRSGNDLIWVPSVSEIIQYFHARDKTKYIISDSENLFAKEIVIDQSQLPEYVKMKAVSFKIKSDIPIDSLEIHGHLFRFKRLNSNEFLVDFEPE
ncbi:MAG: hypothetical protein J7L95_02455 [Prolixibacteraceae bacterium]|nr:hypothetical protein [Prolixibacteraceae bacterium]